MAVTFTGTNTGKTYVEGQSYVSAGRVYTAQSDGTFKTTNSNGQTRSTVGSSQDPRVTFGSTGGGSAASGGGGGRQQPVSAGGGTGPGRPGVVSGGGYPGAGPGAGPLAAGPVRQTAARAGMPVTTQIWIGGQKAAMDPGWSDGGDGEQRWGEWGGSLYGLGVMGADGVKWIGDQLTPKFHEDAAKLPKSLADGAVDLAGYLDAQRSAVLARDGYVSTNGFGSTSGTRNDLDGPFYRTGGGF